MKIFDTLTRDKKELVPLQDKKISMYVCGITPYDTTHLGHAFVYNFFDVLKRYMEHKGFEVNYSQNVTDIDDDILKRAKRDNADWISLGQMWTDKFLEDLKNLNIKRPDNYVKATDSIPRIIEIVQSLISKNFAYEKEGNVYLDVEKFPEYGRLSKLNAAEMIELSKERGADPADPRKKNPLDFILWQLSLLGEPFWESPWGKGRPGWHIECSAMIKDTLGDQVDIHGGGGDLIFPHHESEIAQMESYSGKKPFVSNWMEVGMLFYQGEKMSKSLGNLVLVSDLLKKYSPGAIRLLLLSHHYRKEWEYKDSDIEEAQKEFDKLKEVASAEGEINTEYLKQFEGLMEDDFDTSEVIRLMELMIEKIKEGEKLGATLYKISQLLGLFDESVSIETTINENLSQGSTLSQEH